ncbi:hypothetical protein [Sphingobacterium sp. JB170]|uniref:hypothetical protein n=1 Tax=Sphingobacterium sp. JB170 TaxID=1434842 RepID=UPI00117B73DF|nr:hypothetical protein [Sphingobacterium sp. JB170]
MKNVSDCNFTPSELSKIWVSDISRSFEAQTAFAGIYRFVSWLFIHVVSLVNYNNRIKTTYSWIEAYLTHDQHLRMIFRGSRDSKINGVKDNK